jgi:hypothetical protein
MKPPPILVSYPYLKEPSGRMLAMMKRLGQHVPVMIDSGAYSAQRLGKPVDLDEYTDKVIEYTATVPNLWGCVQLDVLGNATKTRHNLDHMVARGAHPMPVLTVDRPAADAHDLMLVNHRICVGGGLGQFAGAGVWARSRYRAIKAAAGPGSQIHALGYVRYPSFLSCGLSSVDSSSLSYGYRMGIIRCFTEGHGMRCYRPDKWRPQFARLGITRAAFVPENLKGTDTSIPFFVSCHGAIAIAEASRRHGLLVFQAIAELTILMAVAAICSATRGQRFSYPCVRAEFGRIKALPNDARDDAIVDAFAKAAA